MHAQCDGQLDICGAAGDCDEYQIMAVFRFGKDLVQVGAEHGWVDDGKVYAWYEGDGARFFFRGFQNQCTCFVQEVISFGDAEVTLGERRLACIGGYEFHDEG